MTTEAYIAIGSNLGDRRSTISSAIVSISRLGGTSVDTCSEIIQTDPVGSIEQGNYLNGVVRVQTTSTARMLLNSLLEIEAAHGRDRGSEQRWGPRTLDLDLLVFGTEIIDEPGLVVPHPRLHERLFVLVPLTQIAPDLWIPGQNETPRQLLKAIGGAV